MTSLSLVILGIVGWFWFDALRTQEAAKTICRQICRELDLQMLDDTVALVKTRLKRNKYGRLQWQRTYSFEFSDTGQNRQRGTLLMLGVTLEILELPGRRTISLV